MDGRIEIPFQQLSINAFQIWNQSLLLTAGKFEPGGFNPMTIGWGTIGVMWKKPMIMVAVRPNRHTYRFIEAHDTFTVCAFPHQYQKALVIMGSQSGRDTDKVSAAGLTPIASTRIHAPGFNEADLIFECSKRYSEDLLKEKLPGEVDRLYYNNGDYHRFYFGEILAVYGDEKYKQA